MAILDGLNPNALLCLGLLRSHDPWGTPVRAASRINTILALSLALGMRSRTLMIRPWMLLVWQLTSVANYFAKPIREGLDCLSLIAPSTG